MQETWVPSLGQEDPLEEEMVTHSSIRQRGSLPFPIPTRGSDLPVALLLLEGVPGLPGAPQDEAGLTRNFETKGQIWLLLLGRQTEH